MSSENPLTSYEHFPVCLAGLLLCSIFFYLFRIFVLQSRCILELNVMVISIGHTMSDGLRTGRHAFPAFTSPALVICVTGLEEAYMVACSFI